MPEWCLKAAQSLLDKWSIGEWSRFCDDPPDFDSAEVEQIAEVIWNEYQSTQEQKREKRNLVQQT